MLQIFVEFRYFWRFDSLATEKIGG